MSRPICAGVVAAVIASSIAASADTATFEFKVQNVSGAAASVSVDGKTACSLAAGATCTVSVKDLDAQHAYAFALAGGTPVAFNPGNMETVDLCKIDAKGARCAGADGTATN